MMWELPESSALLVIDAQKGFQESFWGKRNNWNAEKNIQSLLKLIRSKSLPVIHIQHISRDPNSPLRPQHQGVEFLPEAQPQEGEFIFQKSVNSAFIGTRLEDHLNKEKIRYLVMVGFTSDHCVSTTARMASNLGFEVSIVSDATVAFERRGSQIFSADLVHEVSLASLSGEFATILDTREVYRKFTESLGPSPSDFLMI